MTYDWKTKGVFTRGRILTVQRRKEMVVGIDLKNRTENIKKSKEDIHNAKIANHKKSYEDAIKDDEVEHNLKKKRK